MHCYVTTICPSYKNVLLFVLDVQYSTTSLASCLFSIYLSVLALLEEGNDSRLLKLEVSLSFSFVPLSYLMFDVEPKNDIEEALTCNFGCFWTMLGEEEV